MKFSIVVVCLNPGDKLKQTLSNILEQTYRDYEIIVKDGGSCDGSVEEVQKLFGIEKCAAAQSGEVSETEKRIRLYVEKDRSIYQAMNQAVGYARGEFVMFMNCGDLFYKEDVLEKAAEQIAGHPHPENLVLYGDTYGEKNDVMIASPPRITGFTCYRNIPCHQSCIYAARLCKEKPYDEAFRIRADYDHFLWCYYVAGADMVSMKIPVASYEGGGYSESRENRKRDKEEHRLITAAYMSKGELFKYRLIMLATLAPLRSFLAENEKFSGVYHWLKDKLYR